VISFRAAVAGRRLSAVAGAFVTSVAGGFLTAVAMLLVLAPSPARAGDLTAGGGTRSRFNVVLTDRLGPWVAGQSSATPGLVLDAGLLAIDTRVTPIAWLSLSALVDGGIVRLQWSITGDSDAAGFVVERGIGRVDPASETYIRLTPDPLGPDVREYLDRTPPAGDDVSYRLMGIDRQGRIFVTEPIRVSIDAAPLAFAVANPVPNPAPGRTGLALVLPAAGPVRLRVFDIAGRLVADAFDADLPAGRHQLTWQAGDTAAGVYFLRLEAAGRHEVRRVVLTRG
jgi:hypothetical protein